MAIRPWIHSILWLYVNVPVMERVESTKYECDSHAGRSMRFDTKLHAQEKWW